MKKTGIKLSKFADRIVGQSMFQVLDKAKELERQGRELIHFEIGDTHLEMPQEVKDTAITSLNAGHTHYGSSYGEYSLRVAIQKSISEDFSFKPDLSQIVVTSGANPLIYYILSILVNPGEEVILTDPSFVTYNAVINMLKLRGVRIPISHKDGFRLNPSLVEKRITSKTRVIVLNSPSNPTGAVYSKEDMTRIYELAKKYNLYIISDEIYSRLVYEGRHFSAGTLDKCKERVIMTNGFSKPFAMTGWRVGYAIGPTKIIEKIALLSQTIVSCVPPFLQDACITALENRQEFSKRYIQEYRKLRDIVSGELSKFDKLEFIKPHGAFYLMIDVSKTGMDGDQFTTHAMEKEGVVVCPGSGFGPGGKKYVRLCYANTEERLREGCRRLGRAANSAKK
ncbi:MAG: pyridoxal phosphate-dependent aminotransferase [Candidatus Taylorbacteria bacterium]|nr:pyridoxal phosphate-dependent aminotransferase [Candidatus Taylorbacteria bacterium]